MHAILSFAGSGIKRHESADRERVGRYFSRILHSGQRLQKLLDRLISLAKLETGQIKISQESGDLALLVGDVLMEFDEVIEQKQIELVRPVFEPPIFARSWQEENRVR